MVHLSPYGTVILVFPILCLVLEPNLNVSVDVISIRSSVPIFLQYFSARSHPISESEDLLPKEAPRNWFSSFFIVYTEKSSSIMYAALLSSDSPSLTPSPFGSWWWKIVFGRLCCRSHRLNISYRHHHVSHLVNSTVQTARHEWFSCSQCASPSIPAFFGSIDEINVFLQSLSMGEGSPQLKQQMMDSESNFFFFWLDSKNLLPALFWYAYLTWPY